MDNKTKTMFKAMLSPFNLTGFILGGILSNLSSILLQHASPLSIAFYFGETGLVFAGLYVGMVFYRISIEMVNMTTPPLSSPT
jgi:hypothetical protein